MSKNNPFVNKFTINEKIKYFNDRLKNKNISSANKKIIMEKRNNLLKIKKDFGFGNVYIVNDKKMGNKTQEKPRAIVVIKNYKNTVRALGLYHSGRILPLEKFDGDRVVSFNHIKTIDKNDIYEKKSFGFNDLQNSLTNNEKSKLKDKTKAYYKDFYKRKK